jgi:hypothetical protein
LPVAAALERAGVRRLDEENRGEGDGGFGREGIDEDGAEELRSFPEKK